MHAQDMTMNDETHLPDGADVRHETAGNGPDVAIDLGGLGCPLLGLKSMKALRSLEPGQTVEIATAGPGGGKALRRVAWLTGAKLLSVREEDGRFKHRLRKG